MSEPIHDSEGWRRPPAVAGTFYTDDACELRKQLAEFCAPNDEPLRRPTAILSPHAGYRYSGKIAGEIFRRIQVPRLAIVLCPNHTGQGVPVSIWNRGTWETPMGDVFVDETAAVRLLSLFGESAGDRRAHRREHAVEVQLPFLLHRNPEVRIVPVVLGPLSEGTCSRLGEALAQFVGEFSPGEVLLVASTDMSHYLPADRAKQLDELALARVRQVDGPGLYRTVVQNEISMCGFIPTTVALVAAQRLGVKDAEVIAYGTSGDVTGDRSDVVSYAAARL